MRQKQTLQVVITLDAPLQEQDGDADVSAMTATPVMAEDGGVDDLMAQLQALSTP